MQEHLIGFRDYLIGLVVMFWAFLAPVTTFIHLIGVLVLIDLFTGLWKALRKKEKITSYGLRATVSKSLAYMLSIIVAFVLDRILGSDDLLSSRTVGGLIGCVETKSVLENLAEITGINLWSAILEKLRPSKENKDDAQD